MVCQGVENMIKLIEVCESLRATNGSQKSYALREIYVNPKHVVSLREETSYKQKLAEGQLPNELDSRQSFTRVTLDKGNSGLDVVVVGPPGIVESKLNGDKRELLHG
jgi:hypothetical protein